MGAFLMLFQEIGQRPKKKGATNYEGSTKCAIGPAIEIGYKIREARMDKVPHMIIVGEKEQNKKSVSVRQRDSEPDMQEMGEV